MPERLAVSFLGCSAVPHEIMYLAQNIRHDEEDPHQLWYSIQRGAISEFELEKHSDNTSNKQTDQAQFLFLVKNISIATYNNVVSEYSKIIGPRNYSKQLSNLAKLQFVVPPALLSDNKVIAQWQHLQKEVVKFIHLCASRGLSISDYKLSLPMVALPRDLLAFDFKTLQSFLDSAMCEQSGWEIKTLAWELYEVMKTEFKILSQRLGIKCWENRQTVCDESLQAYNQCRFGKSVRPHQSSLKTMLPPEHYHQTTSVSPNYRASSEISSIRTTS